MASNLRVFWQALVQGLFINATLREMFLLPRRLPLMPGAWRGMSKEALSAIVMLREMLLPPLLLLMPGALQGITEAASTIAMPREMLPVLLAPGAWQGLMSRAYTLTATATAMPS